MGLDRQQTSEVLTTGETLLVVPTCSYITVTCNYVVNICTADPY